MAGLHVVAYRQGHAIETQWRVPCEILRTDLVPGLEFLGTQSKSTTSNDLRRIGMYPGGLACQVVSELRSFSFVPSADLSMGC